MLTRIIRASRRFGRNPLSILGFVLLMVIVLGAVLAHWITPYPQHAGAVVDIANSGKAPSWLHPFGTDTVGRDILTRIAFAYHLSLLLGIVVLSIATPVGVVVGLLAGYLGGWRETVLMRVTDVFLSIPPLVLALAILGFLKPDLINAMLAVSVMWWPWYARLTYNVTRQVATEGYVAAAEVVGASTAHIVFREILPNCAAPIVTKMTLDLGFVILIGSSLSFLGLGVQPPTADLGSMVAEGAKYLPDLWWLAVFPGLAILLVVLGFNLMGDGISDLFGIASRLATTRLLGSGDPDGRAPARPGEQDQSRSAREGAATGAAAPLLDVDRLRLTLKDWDGTAQILNGVDLSVHAGERVALVGESGCGKTLTARLAMGLFHARGARVGGHIHFDGDDLLTLAARGWDRLRGRRLTMIFQDPVAALNPVFTVEDQFAAVIRRGVRSRSRKDMRAIAGQALTAVAISDPERVLDSYPFQLSGGLNQRVLIAMALINHPALVLADEPGTALDVTVQAQTLALMRELTEASGAAVLLITHNLGVVRNFAQRVYVMYAGSIVEEAPVAALFATPRHPYTQALFAAVPRLTGGALPVGIEGGVPNYRDPPPGCRFHPRCPHAQLACRQPPPLVTVARGHRVACVLYREQALTDD